MPRVFNTEQLQDESLRILYDYVIERTYNIFKVFKDVYTVNSTEKDLLIQYFFTTHFQAEAFKSSKQLYNIGIHSPTLLLTRTLFDVLLTKEKIGGAITGEMTSKKLVTFNLIYDVRKILRQKKVEINNDPDRILVSGILTDLNGTFIALHEMGHIVLGHIDTAKAHFNDDQVLEVFSFKKRRRKEAEIRQGMEHDADMVAARLIPQYIEQLFTKIQKDQRYQKAFKMIIHSTHPFEKLTAICISSIYAIFLYMFGPNTVSDFRYSAHHHPLTRINTVMNGIIRTLNEKWDLDVDFLTDYHLTLIDEINTVFEDLGIINHGLFSPDFIDNMDHDVQRIINLSAENRNLSQPYSWLPSSEW